MRGYVYASQFHFAGYNTQLARKDFIFLLSGSA